jgi:hypothetical protein
MRIVLKHLRRYVSRNRHYGAITRLRFGKLCDRVVPQIMEAQVWESGGCPKIAPCRAPTSHRPRRVEVRGFARGEDIMVRQDISERMGAPIEREYGTPRISVKRDDLLLQTALSQVCAFYSPYRQVRANFSKNHFSARGRERTRGRCGWLSPRQSDTDCAVFAKRLRSTQKKHGASPYPQSVML